MSYTYVMGPLCQRAEPIIVEYCRGKLDYNPLQSVFEIGGDGDGQPQYRFHLEFLTDTDFKRVHSYLRYFQPPAEA